MQLGGNAETKESNLSKTAKEVFPEMGEFYKEAREFIETLGKSEVQIANEVIGLDMQLEGYEARGEEVPEQLYKEYQSVAIDFRINLQQIKSTILSDVGLTDRQKRIRRNFVDKLERIVISSTPHQMTRHLEKDHE